MVMIEIEELKKREKFKLNLWIKKEMEEKKKV